MVKMLSTTFYEGVIYLEGETYPVNEILEKRWIENRIAVKEQNDLFFPDFDSMTDEEIAQFAEDNGKDISKARTRATAIRILSK